jgi:hypothetical protein
MPIDKRNFNTRLAMPSYEEVKRSETKRNEIEAVGSVSGIQGYATESRLECHQCGNNDKFAQMLSRFKRSKNIF